MSDAETPALSLGVVVGGTGRDARKWGDAVMQLARRVKSERAGVDSPLRVNVVYQVPGEVVQVKFSGVRTGRYSATERLLLIQAALPVGAVPPNAEDILLQLLDAAIGEADLFAQKKGLTDNPLEEIRALASPLKTPEA
ncbi:hypothetical protein [Cryobacterium sp. HLT2-28]|uniref:hypothetical protein n=1 Tax=Cryobacterium sp. HLT2-28 TaxID=1259146 RepID=UPI001069EB78|nr:hypothetical protein [Cryobacterium sp. HLT2-28]TFB94554.1 hypothetical protein E3O48_08045 [Cryobacterium sp. HLT2-28]